MMNNGGLIIIFLVLGPMLVLGDWPNYWSSNKCQRHHNYRYNNEIWLPIDPDLLIPSKIDTIQSNKFRTWLQPNVQRRFLMMFPPFKRLLMAYFAPRILRFQMSMLMSSLLGELSRKFLDPLLEQKSSISSFLSSTKTTGTTTPVPTLVPPPSSTSPTPISLDQAFQIQRLARLLTDPIMRTTTLPPPTKIILKSPKSKRKKSSESSLDKHQEAIRLIEKFIEQKNRKMKSDVTTTTTTKEWLMEPVPQEKEEEEEDNDDDSKIDGNNQDDNGGDDGDGERKSVQQPDYNRK